jgi:hypothetical protein
LELVWWGDTFRRRRLTKNGSELEAECNFAGP